MDEPSRLARLSDPELPAASLLFGPSAAEMLNTADGLVDGRAVGAIPKQVLWRPGRELIVSYAVQLDTGGSGSRVPIVAATGTAIPPELSDGDPGQVVAWRTADDPRLPGLASALHPPTIEDMLTVLGVPRGPVTARLRAYRPTRRAVVQVSHPDVTVYLKVVRPAEIRHLDELHRFVHGALPIPRTMGVDPDLGIVVLEALPGRTLREQLAATETVLPDPAVLLDLLDALPLPPDARVIAGPTGSVGRHARILALVVPEYSDLVDELAGGCSPPPSGEPNRAVHGDFYESQLLVRGGSVSGLIDIDRMGVGRRVDDVATLVAHLAALAPSAPDTERVHRYGSRLIAVADASLDAAELRRVTAASLFGLATGPFRAQSSSWPLEIKRRLDAAAAWIGASEGERAA